MVRKRLVTAGVILVLLCLRFCPAAAAADGGPQTGWKLDFGAEERLRVEHKSDFDLDDGLNDDGGLVYQRIKLNGRAQLKGRYELFAEAMDLRVGSAQIAKTAQADDLDLHQAYFIANNVFGSALAVKAGRQEMKYGQGRMILSAGWSNRISHMDAAVLKYGSGGLSADVFYGARVSYDEDGWNDPNRHDILSGAYLSYRQGGDVPLVEGYFLSNYDGASMSALNRHTAGVRGQFVLPGAVVCDVEVPYQFGKSSRKSVYAYAFHLDLSREFERAWSPRAAVALNYASGDKNPADSVDNTFVPLYQGTHEFYGQMDFFRWQNMKELALELAVRPGEDLKITAATNFFWLARVRDSWYDSSGRKLRTSAAGTAGAYVGREASLLVKYDLGGGAVLDGGYARFFTGAYVKDTGTHDTADWLYLQFCLKI